MKKSIKTISLAFLAASLLSGCAIGQKSSSAPASSGSGSSPSSSSSEPAPQPVTLEDTLALLAEKAAAKRGFLLVPEYRETEYLGSNLVVYNYIGEYADSGTVYYFVNEQGYFAYQYVDGDLELRDFELDPTIDLYSDVLYSAFDVIDEDFANYVELSSETEDAFVTTFNLSEGSAYKGAFAELVGYDYDQGSKVTAVEMTIAKDASSIDFDLTYNGHSEPATLSYFGTFEDAEAVAFVEAIPPYEPVVAWPAEQISAYFESKGEPEFAVPAMEGEGFTYVVEEYSSFLDITVEGATAADLPTYVSACEDAGWTVTSSYTNYYNATKTFTDGIAKISFAYSSYYGFYIDIYAKMDPLPNYEWPADDIAAAFAAKEQTPFNVPALEGEGYTYVFDDYYVDSLGVARVFVTGPTSENLPDYVSAFEDAGWTVTYNEEEKEYTAKLQVADGIQKVIFYFYNSYVGIQIYLIKDPLPAAEWPTADLATLFGELGYTHTLPAYEGAATAYQLFTDPYTYVVVTVGEGNEEGAVESYAATLLADEFTSLGSDSSGDSYYMSPDEDYIVCPYVAETGTFTIYFYANPTIHYDTFPLAYVNSFLEENSMDFQLESALPDASGEGFDLIEGEDDYGYPNLQFSAAGDQSAAWAAIIGPLAEDAGYTDYSSDDYSVWQNDYYSYVYIEYDSSANTTYILFQS